MPADLGPVGEIDRAGWRAVLGLAADEQPAAVIVEGTWWREERTRRRLARLDGVRELGIPDVFLGAWRGRHVLYACAYGAPRSAEVIHVGARVGARLAMQLGSCGILGDGIRPGEVIVPTRVRGLDGTSALYSDAEEITATDTWTWRAADLLRARDIDAHVGQSVSWPTLFNQPLEHVRRWRRDGYLGVDMETATTLAVAAMFAMPGVSMLAAWDEILSGRSFLDPLAGSVSASFQRAEHAVFDVALELVEAL